MTTRISHWIDGRESAGTSGRTAPVFNPATGAQTGEVDLASASEVDAAVARAAEAARSWRQASLSRRSAVLFAFRELPGRGHEPPVQLRVAAHLILGKLDDPANSAGPARRSFQDHGIQRCHAFSPVHAATHPVPARATQAARATGRAARLWPVTILGSRGPGERRRRERQRRNDHERQRM